MKVVYETPKIEVVEFETEDVITCSGGTGIDPGNNLPALPIDVS